MKCRSVFTCLAILLTLTVISPAQSGNSPEPGGFGVRGLMTQSTPPQGEIQVRGVVSQVFPEQDLLALIDIAEVEECGVLTCARLTLPVRWTGSMPEPGAVITALGQVKAMDGGSVFAASHLEPCFTGKGE